MNNTINDYYRYLNPINTGESRTVENTPIDITYNDSVNYKPSIANLLAKYGLSVDNPNSNTNTSLTQSPSSTNTNPMTKSSMADSVANGWKGMSLGQKANTVMGTVGTLMNAYNAYKANKLAKEQFNHAKQVSEQNWQAQRKQTNSQLEDRQRRRVEEAQANGRTTTSVGDYMAKYGI